MAWSVSGNNLTMCEGDYGVKLKTTLNEEITLSASDKVLFTFKTQKNGDTLFTKEYGDIQDNIVWLEFTQEESALLPVGTYAYSLDWYQNGAFLCNITPSALLKVVDKA